MKDENREIYQTMICMSCGKSFPFNSELISFVCDECLRESSDLYSNHLDIKLNSILNEVFEELFEAIHLQSKKEEPKSMLHFTIKYTCPKCKKGKCETKTIQDGDYTYIVCKNFVEKLYKGIKGEDDYV